MSAFGAQRWTTTVSNTLARKERQRKQREADRKAAAKAAGRDRRSI